jgi:hypothetical protein
MAAGRGAALLAVAVILGIVLLNAADDPPAEVVATGSADDDGGKATTSTTQAQVLTTLAPAPLRAPKDVKVISANGTTVKGVARKVTDELKAAGYNVLAPTDAPQRTQASSVYFAGDFEREAKAVGESLGLPVTAVQALPAPPPLPDTRGANVVVVVGPELAQRLSTTATTAAANPAAGATTSTTAAVTATTKR